MFVPSYKSYINLKSLLIFNIIVTTYVPTAVPQVPVTSSNNHFLKRCGNNKITRIQDNFLNLKVPT